MKRKGGTEDTEQTLTPVPVLPATLGGEGGGVGGHPHRHNPLTLAP